MRLPLESEQEQDGLGLTDDEIEQLANLSLETKTFGHFVVLSI